MIDLFKEIYTFLNRAGNDIPIDRPDDVTALQQPITRWVCPDRIRHLALIPCAAAALEDVGTVFPLQWAQSYSNNYF